MISVFDPDPVAEALYDPDPNPRLGERREEMISVGDGDAGIYVPGGPAPPAAAIPGAALSAVPATRGLQPPAKGGFGGSGVPQNINALHNYYNLFGHLGVVGPGMYNALLE